MRSTRAGRAVIAVSGGSTPKPLYTYLAQQDLDWSRVTIVLVDERWVEPGQAGSNESFVRSTLLDGAAVGARFVGLKTEGETPLEGLDEARIRLEDVKLPFDLVLLGLGGDGHTASWFPRADGLADALSMFGDRVAAVRAHQTDVTGVHTQRMTLTRGAFVNARAIWLMMAGDGKKTAWEQALSDGPVADMPVRALLRDPAFSLQAHWAPNN